MNYVILAYIKEHNGIVRTAHVWNVGTYEEAVEAFLYDLSPKFQDEISEIYVAHVRDMKKMPWPVDKPTQG